MRSKKGFTLVELLAIIVILAIIALIATPIVLKVMENAKKGAAKSSATSYIKAVETYVVSSKLGGTSLSLNVDEKYNCTTNTIFNLQNHLPVNDLVELKGSKPTGDEDYIILGNKKTVKEGKVTIDGYEIIIKDYNIISVIKVKKIKIEKLDLNIKTQTMEKGSTFTLEPIFTPNNATDQRVTYKSSSENVVTVSDTGLVTAKGVGNAKITVTSKDDKTKKEECDITVIVSASSVEISPSEKEIEIGKTVQLTGTIEPGDVTTNALTWTSSSESIAHVDNSGLVTGMGEGTATITASTVNGKTATSKITVKQVMAESITLNKTNFTLEKGSTEQLTGVINPSNTLDKSMIWTSSNTSVATVSSTGLVTAIGAGNTTITVKTSNGKIATCNVTVIVSPVSISLNQTSVTLEKGSTSQLTTTINPSDTTNKSVTWTSSNTSVATVSASGLVTAVNVGSATITVKTSNGKTATCNITVIISPTSVSLNTTYSKGYVGTRTQLIATVNPSNATNQAVTWTSSNTSVATVSSNGYVDRVGEGIATITVRTSNGYTATARIDSEIDYSYIPIYPPYNTTTTTTKTTTKATVITTSSGGGGCVAECTVLPNGTRLCNC